jgi:hypothetical protein
VNPTMLVITLIFVLPTTALVTWALGGLLQKLSSRGRVLHNCTPAVDQTAIRTTAPAPHGVPDYVSPVVAYRTWQWDSSRLKSFNGERWTPNQTLQIKCKKSFWRHHAPHARCSCGIYAAKSLIDLFLFGYARRGICGEVYLWGTVVEHEQGWRAQYAYPKSLIVDPLGLSLCALIRRELLIGNPERWLTPLTAYGADIFLADDPANIPLWTHGSGFDPKGLDRLKDLSPVFKECQRERALDAVYRLRLVLVAALSTGILIRSIEGLAGRLPIAATVVMCLWLFFFLHGFLRSCFGPSLQAMLWRYDFLSMLRELRSSREYKWYWRRPPPPPPGVPVHSTADVIRIAKSSRHSWPADWVLANAA